MRRLLGEGWSRSEVNSLLFSDRYWRRFRTGAQYQFCWFVTFRPLCNEFWQFRNHLSTLARFRSKRRSTRQWTFVTISLRSQMLYPVELRAPVRESVNLRSNDRTVKSCWKKNTTVLRIRID